jgi:LPS-assembly protein
LIGDNVQLTDTLRDGTIDNLMVVLESGGRLAARRGTRLNGVGTFYNAIYSPCPVTSDTGCPKRPSWAVTAARVIDDPNSTHIRFEGARFQLFGINLPLLPVFNVAKGNEGVTGLLVPDIALSSRNGLRKTCCILTSWMSRRGRPFRTQWRECFRTFHPGRM